MDLEKLSEYEFKLYSGNCNRLGSKKWRVESTSRIFLEGGIAVVCYVDDILIYSRQEDEIDQFRASLETHFMLKMLLHPEEFLGIEIPCIDEHTFGLRPSNSIRTLLTEHGMEHARATSCPMTPPIT